MATDPATLLCGAVGCEHSAPYVYWRGAVTTNNQMGAVSVTGIPTSDAAHSDFRFCQCCAIKRFRVAFGYPCSEIAA